MKKAIAVFVICCFVAAFADNPHITQLVELFDVAISAPADGDVLTFDAASGKWANKPVAPAPEGPKIVARFDQDGITTTTTDLPLFTAAETAIYRISAITEDTDLPNNPTQAFLYTSSLDKFGVAVTGNPLRISSTILQWENVYTVRLTAGDTVHADTTTTGPPFNLHITFEKL